VLESRIHDSAYALQVWGITARLHGHPVFIRASAIGRRATLASILLADAVVNQDDRAMPNSASDKITVSGFMADLPISQQDLANKPAVGTTSALSGNTVLASTLSSTLK